MSDIVERLRAQSKEDHIRGCMGRQYTCDCGYDLKTEGLLEIAADEIEQLGALAAIVREQGFEIERLRAKIKRWEAQSIAQYAEIKRLRAAVPAEIAKGTYALAQEIERLTVALAEAQDLLSDGPGGPRRISAMEVIRRALEPKP